jgi:hypothetical protein
MIPGVYTLREKFKCDYTQSIYISFFKYDATNHIPCSLPPIIYYITVYDTVQYITLNYSKKTLIFLIGLHPFF